MTRRSKIEDILACLPEDYKFIRFEGCNSYQNEDTRLTFKCPRGHTWTTAAANVKSGRLCRQCRDEESTKRFKARKLSEEYLRDNLSKEGWELISYWHEGRSRLIIEAKCPAGHRQNKSWDSWRLHRGCERCAHSFFNAEEICRGVFEHLFEKAFPKRRFGRVEFDGYCEELKIAFEYQGFQHYKHHHIWHKGKRTLEAQKTRDRKKEEFSREKKITLVTIPYIIQPSEFESHIISELQKQGRNIKKLKRNADIEKITKERKLMRKNYLLEMQEIAKKRGGKCLSIAYINNSSKLRFECARGHQFSARPHNIKNGTWCPICNNEKKTQRIVANRKQRILKKISKGKRQECKYCGKIFDPLGTNRKYCNTECRNKFYYKDSYKKQRRDNL